MLIYMLVGVAIFITIPIIIDRLIIGNSFPSNMNNGEWFQFLGSYVGSTFGSALALLGALYVMNKTNENTRKMQRNYVDIELSFKILEIVSEYRMQAGRIYKNKLNKAALQIEMNKIKNRKISNEELEGLRQLNKELNNIKGKLKKINIDKFYNDGLLLKNYLKLNKAFINPQKKLVKIKKHIKDLDISEEDFNSELNHFLSEIHEIIENL